MYNEYNRHLEQLKQEGRYRVFPDETIADKVANGSLIDFSSNDYMGLNSNRHSHSHSLQMTSSASRMLATCQEPYARLEGLLTEMYGRPALLFNSGYHANSGIIPALAIGNTLVVSDKLVHASIIDGIRLTHTQNRLRFRHNDIQQLQSLVEKNYDSYDNILVITESVFSMDGDEAPLQQMVELKRHFPKVMLYVDIAHSVGALGECGIGFRDKNLVKEIDIIVGTFGKACASMGAFVVADALMIDYLRNTARSLIFSTALPPACIEHTYGMMQRLKGMDTEREKLAALSKQLREGIERITGEQSVSTTHIVPLMVGDAKKVVQLSAKLRELGFLGLPIRKPTVPAGTERIRFSLSAAHTREQIEMLLKALSDLNIV